MFVVGVDGGTTKTIALVADDQGHILGAYRGGGSNWSGEDVQIPMRVVAETVRGALKNAGVSAEVIEMGVFTLAGADWPEDHTRRAEELSHAGIARQVRVKNDSFGGLRAGIREPYGMVLAVGTGMNAAVITPDGTEWAFGYYETGGGAGTLSQQAFEAVLRAEDGRGMPTVLTHMVINQLSFPTVEAMLRAYVLQRIENGRFYTLAPLVFQAALQGDAVATEIIIRQGKVLAEYATTMARRFKMRDLAFDVVLAGSVFKGVGPLLIDTITQEIHAVAPYARIVRARYEPAVGSVLLAYDALGVPVTEEMYANLAATVPSAELFNTLNGAGYVPVRPQEEEA